MWFVGAPASLAAEDVVPPAAGLRLTRPVDRHLTLVYLGHVPADVARRVWDALPRLALPAVATGLRWERFGRSAIALVLADDDGSLRRAADRCVTVADAAVASFRPPTEFRPHLTVGRVRKGARPPARRAMAGWPLPPGPLGLGPVTLFRSRDATDPAPERYERVAQQPR